MQARRRLVVWWLAKISSSTTKKGVYLVRFLEDPGPIKLPLPAARHDLDRRGTRFLVPESTLSQRVCTGGPT